MVIFNRPNTVRSMITCQIFHHNFPIQPITFTSRCSEKAARAVAPKSLLEEERRLDSRERRNSTLTMLKVFTLSQRSTKKAWLPEGNRPTTFPRRFILVSQLDLALSASLTWSVKEKSVCNVVFNLPFWGSFAQDTWPRRCRIRIGSSKLRGLHSSWLGNVKDWHAVDISCCTTDVHNTCCRWSVCPGQVGYPWCWTQRKWK